MNKVIANNPQTIFVFGCWDSPTKLCPITDFTKMLDVFDSAKLILNDDQVTWLF